MPWDYGITAEQLFCRTLIIWRQRSRIQHVDLLRQALGLDWAVLKDLPQDHFTQNAEKVYGNVKLSLVGVRHVTVTKILQVDSASESTIFESLRDAPYKELLHFKFLTKWPVQVCQKVLYFRGAGIAAIIHENSEGGPLAYNTALPVLGIREYKSMSAHEPFSSVLRDESLFSGLTVHKEG